MVSWSIAAKNTATFGLHGNIYRCHHSILMSCLIFSHAILLHPIVLNSAPLEDIILHSHTTYDETHQRCPSKSLPHHHSAKNKLNFSPTGQTVSLKLCAASQSRHIDSLAQMILRHQRVFFCITQPGKIFGRNGNGIARFTQGEGSGGPSQGDEK